MRKQLTVSILTCVNLLNYMDRFSVAGVLLKVKNFYNISDTQIGLLTTIFILSYMILSPVFGYLGDRYSRKLILAGGIAFWSLSTLASSFVDSNGFYGFLFLRALIGIGEASYSTVAPTIIADLFSGGSRTKALSVYYFAVPLGSGLGYMVGSKIADLFGAWQWALRVTPVFGLLCTFLVLLFVLDPPRGAADQSNHIETTSWLEDVKYLLHNKTYLLTSFGVTCVAFVTGALALWAPLYVYFSVIIQNREVHDSTVSMAFGAITCLAGILGVLIGSYGSSVLRKVTSKADPFICAFGLLASGPCLYVAITISKFYVVVTFVSIFVAETLMFLNWALVSDMTLYLVVPTRRSTANSLQILLSHALGDAGSPTLLGFISDSIKRSGGQMGVIRDFTSLQSSLYLTCFVSVLGGAFFLFSALFIDDDRSKTSLAMKGYEQIKDVSTQTTPSKPTVEDTGCLTINVD